MSDFLLSAAQEKLVVQNVSAKIVELILSQILEEDNFEFHINILQLFILRTLRSGKYLFIVIQILNINQF